jgi:hypothetical protein
MFVAGRIRTRKYNCLAKARRSWSALRWLMPGVMLPQNIGMVARKVIPPRTAIVKTSVRAGQSCPPCGRTGDHPPVRRLNGIIVKLFESIAGFLKILPVKVIASIGWQI